MSLSKTNDLDDHVTSAASDDLHSAMTANDDDGDDIGADQRTQYIASIDAKFQRDVAALMFGLFDSIRYYSKLTFIIIFVTALAHGVFVVLLALKLDGNSIFNWNVTLMPLTIYYGLWFIISVVGFASLPLFTLTADQYTYDLRAAINFSWIAAALDRRIQFERSRLTAEFRKVLANMLPVQSIATWLNAYVETNLVGADAVLAQTLAAVERGDRLLQIRLAKQQELLKKLEELANEGIDRVVGLKSDKATPTAAKPTAEKKQPPATTLTDDDDADENDVPQLPSRAPSNAPMRTAAAVARGISLRSTAPPAIVVHPDAGAAKVLPQPEARPVAPAPSAVELPKLPLGPPPPPPPHASADAPVAPTPRSSMIDAVARLTDALSNRLHDIVVHADPDAAAAADTTVAAEVATSASVPKSTEGAAVARHLLRAVRREARRRARAGRVADAPPNTSLRASQMLEKVLSDLSASDAEPEAAALPSLSELAETLNSVDATTLENVTKTLNAYVSNTATQVKVAVESIVAAPDDGEEEPLPQQQEPEAAADNIALPARRRRRATTRSMGDFLRAMLVGGARDLFGAGEPSEGDNNSTGGSKVGAAIEDTAATIGEALMTARRAASERISSARQAVDEALPPESLLEAFVARGTQRDTQEKADIRRTAVKAMGKQAVSQCAPELVALVSDTNNTLVGVSNTLQAVTRVLRGTHDSALFIAKVSHDVATASTPIEALDRLGHWIHHQAMSQPVPDSLSMSVEERATQRRQLVREKTLEMMSSQHRTDDDDYDELDEALMHAKQQAPIPIRVSPSARDTPIPPTMLAPTRRRRVRAVSPLVFANEPIVQDDDDDDPDVDQQQPEPASQGRRRRSQRRHKRQQMQ